MVDFLLQVFGREVSVDIHRHANVGVPQDALNRHQTGPNAPPWEYLPHFTTKAQRKAHFIPANRTLWKAEKFPEFVAERRRLLAKALTRLVKA